MLGLLRRIVRLRGPMGVVALALGIGLGAGLVATHSVLAAWTYRDASRRDLREPGRWALAVLFGGLVAFPVYVTVQRASDWSSDSRAAGAVRRVADRGRRSGEVVPVEEGAGTDEGDVPGPDDTPSEHAEEDDSLTVETETPEDPSLAATAARYGWRATRKGARWAAGRARQRIAE